ncbi:MAG: FkbM family methyltransferase [Thermoanaerobaculia bacterium]|nr:FkbM family methyltransferase [Thermoanaerobaculia bacterium]
MVAAFLREGGDLFDVGANLGLVTFGVLPVVREMGIGFHLFEANSRLIPLLRRSALEWPSEDVRVVHCCVTDAAGISYHRLPDACWGHGQIDTHGEAVTNLRLDDYVAVADVEAVGFLKLDVEGWELNALRGAESALASGKVKAGFVELVPEALARAGASVADVLTYLQGKGFDVYFAAMWEREDPHGLTWRTVGVNGTELRFAGAVPLPASFAQGDVLVIHRSSPIAAQVSAAF